MFRSIPAPNKLLQKKWREINLEMHYRRIAEAKSSVNNKKPAKTHLGASKSKKDRIVEDRIIEIERDNALLVEKMSSIMRSRSSARALLTTPAKSLNRDFRKRKLVQVTEENLSLLNRLQLQKSSYDVKKLESSRKFHERMLRHLCEFPYTLGRSNSSNKELHTLENPDSKFGSTKSLGSAKPRRLNPIEDEEVVYKSVKKIMKKTFVVAIVKTSKDVKMIVQNTENDESFSLRLTLKEAAQIMEGTQDYERLANALILENDELVLSESKAYGNSIPNIDYDPVSHVLDSVNEQPTELEGKTSEKLSEKTRSVSAFVFPEAESSEAEESKVIQISPKPSAIPIEQQGSMSFESKETPINKTSEPSKPVTENGGSKAPQSLSSQISLKDPPRRLSNISESHKSIPASKNSSPNSSESVSLESSLGSFHEVN